MGLYFDLANFTNLVMQMPTAPIVLNDLSGVTEQERDRITALTTSVFKQTDVFSNEPTCDCGRITGGYNLGIMCANCHAPVSEMFSRDLIARVWIRNPKGVAPLINPLVWNMLSGKFNLSGFNLVEWLCNTDYVPPGDVPIEVTEEVKSYGIQRGYNHFVNNFDFILDTLFTMKKFTKGKTEENRRAMRDQDHLYQLLREKRDCIFSTHLPLPNKALLIREDTNVGSYIDEMVVSIMDAVHLVRGIDTPTCSYPQRTRENRTIKTIIKLYKFYNEVYHSVFAKKQGLLRRQLCGGRCHFSTRAVISSNTKPHAYDELKISWGQGIGLFTLHLKNKLFKLGYTPNEAASLLYEFTNKYHPLLDQLFKELIAETPGGRGFACIFVRNPSLSRSSTQAMWITGVKEDPNDQTTTMSILAVVGFNADFDGDQMSLALMPDNFTAQGIQPLAPHRNIIDPNQPRSLTGVSSIPKPVSSSIGNWMKTPSTSAPDARKQAFLESLAT